MISPSGSRSPSPVMPVEKPDDRLEVLAVSPITYIPGEPPDPYDIFPELGGRQVDSYSSGIGIISPELSPCVDYNDQITYEAEPRDAREQKIKDLGQDLSQKQVEIEELNNSIITKNRLIQQTVETVRHTASENKQLIEQKTHDTALKQKLEQELKDLREDLSKKQAEIDQLSNVASVRNNLIEESATAVECLTSEKEQFIEQIANFKTSLEASQKNLATVKEENEKNLEDIKRMQDVAGRKEIEYQERLRVAIESMNSADEANRASLADNLLLRNEITSLNWSLRCNEWVSVEFDQKWQALQQELAESRSELHSAQSKLKALSAAREESMPPCAQIQTATYSHESDQLGPSGTSLAFQWLSSNSTVLGDSRAVSPSDDLPMGDDYVPSDSPLLSSEDDSNETDDEMEEANILAPIASQATASALETPVISIPSTSTMGSVVKNWPESASQLSQQNMITHTAVFGEPSLEDQRLKKLLTDFSFDKKTRSLQYCDFSESTVPSWPELKEGSKWNAGLIRYASFRLNVTDHENLHPSDLSILKPESLAYFFTLGSLLTQHGSNEKPIHDHVSGLNNAKLTLPQNKMLIDGQWSAPVVHMIQWCFNKNLNSKTALLQNMIGTLNSDTTIYQEVLCEYILRYLGCNSRGGVNIDEEREATISNLSHNMNKSQKCRVPASLCSEKWSTALVKKFLKSFKFICFSDDKENKRSSTEFANLRKSIRDNDEVSYITSLTDIAKKDFSHISTAVDHLRDRKKYPTALTLLAIDGTTVDAEQINLARLKLSIIYHCGFSQLERLNVQSQISDILSLINYPVRDSKLKNIVQQLIGLRFSATERNSPALKSVKQLFEHHCPEVLGWETRDVRSLRDTFPPIIWRDESKTTGKYQSTRRKRNVTVRAEEFASVSGKSARGIKRKRAYTVDSDSGSSSYTVPLAKKSKRKVRKKRQ